MVLREISKTTDASVILTVFSQYARTFLRKSNEYAISILYHKCTIFISFYYISVVNQNVTIFNKTIRDNIILGNSSTTDEEIWEALKIVHLDEFIKELLLGLNTIVSSHGANFSGGQAQRLCLARAIINKPQLLILDEATSSLDTVNENYFYNMIKSLGVTILSISHRLNTVVDSDRIYLIDDGEFVAEGSHESLLKTSNLYAKIYNEKRK